MTMPQRFDRRASDVQPVSPRPDLSTPAGESIGLLTILRRRILLVTCVVAICTMLALIVTTALPRRYVAEASVALDVDPGNALPGGRQDQVVPGRTLEQIVQTEIQIVTSRAMAERVFDDPAVGRDPALARILDRPGTLRTLIGGGATPAVSASPAYRDSAINYLQRGVQAYQQQESAVLRIAFTTGEPALAAQIANAYARAYSSDKVSVAADENQESVAALKTRLAELQERAQAEFAAVQRYRIANNLLSSAATSLTEGEISTYNQQVAGARAQASEDQARLSAARAQLRAGRGTVGEAASSGVIQSLRSQRATLSAQVADMASRYRADHPDLVAARQQVADIDRQIDDEVDRILKSLEARARTSQERLQSLQASRGGARAALAGNNSALVELNELQRRADASQSLYETYLNRYREAVARTGSERAGVRLLSAALEPTAPVSPSLPLNLAFGFLLGCLLGVGGAVLAEANFPGFTTADDVERKLGIPAFGSIPLLKAIASPATSGADAVRLQPGGLIAESVRSVFVRATQVAGRYGVVALASALPNEGKTTMARMLGRVLAAAGQRTLIIDCDVVQRGLSLQAGAASGGPGLADVLAGHVPLDDALVADGAAGPVILPLTAPFPEGQRLMQGRAFPDLLETCRGMFDIVLLDCPPILAIADGREIVGLADVTLFSVLWRKTRAATVLAALRLLPADAVPRTGVFLNKVDIRKRRRFGGSDAAFYYREYHQYYQGGSR